jgi:hypothetical protein
MGVRGEKMGGKEEREEKGRKLGKGLASRQ